MRHFALAAFLLAIALIVSPSYAQKQYNVWYFGDGAGIDFNTTPPTAIRGPFSAIGEGIAVIAHPRTGEILFSTDGRDVFNRGGRRMPNGVGIYGGRGTSTQGVTILPFPLDSFRYYIITADQAGYEGPNIGVHYSTVDMRLAGGLGDVVEKNVFLLPPPMSEKLTAVPHENGCDVWVIGHSGATNEYIAVLLKDSAILPMKVVSAVGITPQDHQESFLENIGELVSSSDGSKLAYIAANGFIELVDFDRATGVVSNPLRLASNGDGFYGGAFSPDGSKLYVASYEPVNLRQYDLSLPRAQIPASGIFVSMSGWNIKPGPDGKLYALTPNQTGLTVIEQPNLRFPACTIVEGGIEFLPGTTAIWGMPSIAPAFMAEFRPCLAPPTVSIQAMYGVVCAGDCIDFSAIGRPNLGYEWQIDNGEVIHDEQMANICFDSAGSFTVLLKGFNDRGDTATDFHTLTIKPAMYFKLHPYSVVTDTIGALIKVPIVLNDTISSDFEAQFSFNPEMLEYEGAFDKEGNPIDSGSSIERGEIRINERIEGDSIVGYMYFNLYWEDTLCRSIHLESSRLMCTSVQCMFNEAQYDLCLDAACGTQMLSQYLRTSRISVSVVPNPAASTIEIRTTHDIERATISLADMNGREVLRDNADLTQSSPRAIDVTGLSEGMYFLSIHSSMGATRETVVIRR